MSKVMTTWTAQAQRASESMNEFQRALVIYLFVLSQPTNTSVELMPSLRCLSFRWYRSAGMFSPTAEGVVGAFQNARKIDASMFDARFG